MDEVFVEQIIKRKINISGMLFRALSILIVLIGLMSMMWLGILGFTITALLIYAAYLIWVYTSVEYEYSFLNGELTIDKILGKQKRKTIESFDMKEAEIIAPAISEEVIRMARNASTKDYSSGMRDGLVYAMVLNNSNGLQQVLFEPNETVIEAMHRVRPSIVKKA